MKTTIKQFGTVYSVLKEAFGQYKTQIAILTGLGFFGALLEGVGINALIPLFSLISGAETAEGLDFISRFIEQILLFFGGSFTLKYILIFVVLLFVLKAGVLFIFAYVKVRIVAHYEYQTRASLLRVTLNAKWPHLIKQRLGYLETLLVTNMRFCTANLETIGQMIIVVTSLLIYTAIAINISLQITLLTLLFGLLILMFFRPILRLARSVGQDTMEATSDVAHHVNESIVGMKTIKILATNKAVITTGNNLFEKLRVLRIRNLLLNSVNSTLIEPLSLIFIVVIFAYSIKTGTFQFAALIAILYLMQKMFGFIQIFQRNLQKFSENTPYLQRVLHYQKETDEMREPKGGSASFSFAKQFTFHNVDFSYNDKTTILKGVTLNINKGEMVGLIGPSGSGKTTIVDLMLRLFEPTSGSIMLDGKDIKNINVEEWRKNIGYVSQDIFLANDTIEQNIKFYDSSISNKDMIRAAKMAHIYDFVNECPDKFKTIVGERGILLSGGQRQRIAIARVLARNPQLLILDEATSALDNESEVEIQKVIEDLKGTITVFAIAHRLSTIMNSDRLFVLEDGKIVEEGNPKKLLKDSSSQFYKVYHIRK